MNTILDAALGRALKKAGMQLALDFSGPWADAALLEFRGWLAIEKARGTRKITIEQFRAQAKNHPESPKSWGCLPGLACKAGLLAPTGEYVKAAAPKTRAHPVALWAVL